MRLRRRWPRRMRRVIEQLRLQSRRKLQLLLGEFPHTYRNLSYYLTNLGLTNFQGLEDFAWGFG